LLFGIIPYSVFYSRVILPEPALVFFATFSLMAFHFWLKQKNWSWYVCSFFSLTLALLMKPSVVFLYPVYGGLILFQEFPIRKWTKKFLIEKSIFYSMSLLPAFTISIIPLVLWRKWMAQFPSGIPAFTWLLNSNGIRFRPAWFRWLFWERMTKLITGYFGMILFVVNLAKIHKDLLVYGSWWGGILLYFAVIATGNVQHDYYQILAVPIVSISMARGAVFLEELLKKKISSVAGKLVVGSLLVGSIFLGWQGVRGYYNINHPEYVVAGQAVDKLTPPDSLVIAPAYGDTQFLFQTNRRGWPIGFDIQDKIKKGASYYVSTSYDDEAKSLESQYTVVEKNPIYILLDLHPPKK
jgi:4-amino-4-deoxy-L-arabinose transferase-like glycosyltransferase